MFHHRSHLSTLPANLTMFPGKQNQRQLIQAVAAASYEVGVTFWEVVFEPAPSGSGHRRLTLI